MTTNTDVYTTDLYAWCLTTAALVRQGQWDAIDPEALAEELESLGKSQKRELESRLEVLVMHLLKWEYQPELQQQSHSWHDTILEQRNTIARLLRDNPSLRPQVPAILADIYPGARQRAIGEMTPEMTLRRQTRARGFSFSPENRLALLPTTCLWTDVEILDKDFWPLS